jgi:hypothetical protein
MPATLKSILLHLFGLDSLSIAIGIIVLQIFYCETNEAVTTDMKAEPRADLHEELL